MLLLMFYWMLRDMCLPEFDNHQGLVAPNCFKSHANSRCPDFFQKTASLVSSLKFTLCDVTSILPENISWLKKFIFRLVRK